MTTDPTALRIPPAIRRRLDGIEAELRPTPQRAPLAGGRPALYVVESHVGTRVRPVHRAAWGRRPARRSALGRLVGASAATALVGLVAMVALGIGPLRSAAPTGPGGASPSGSARVTAASSAAASDGASEGPSASSSAVASSPASSSVPFPSIVDIQVIRVATNPSTVVTRLLGTTCVTKAPGVDPVDVKRVLTAALVNKVLNGWLDDAHTVLVAADGIDAAQTFGGTTLVEGLDETWVIGRDANGAFAVELQSMALIEGPSAWWVSLQLRPAGCP